MGRPKKTTEIKSIKKKPQIFDGSIISDLILKGDLRQFAPEQKAKYYTNLCQSLNLNPLTKPFDLIILNDKETLYANRNCAEQLRKINGISVIDMTKEIKDNLYIVTVKVQDKTGRYDMATGVVSITYPERIKKKDGTWVNHPKAEQFLSGDELANKFMTGETKAKRRATLSICGLGMLDETEIESIPNIIYQQPEIQKINGDQEKKDDPIIDNGLPKNFINPTINTKVKKPKQNGFNTFETNFNKLSDEIKKGFQLAGWFDAKIKAKCLQYNFDEKKLKEEIEKELIR